MKREEIDQVGSKWIKIKADRHKSRAPSNRFPTDQRTDQRTDKVAYKKKLERKTKKKIKMREKHTKGMGRKKALA